MELDMPLSGGGWGWDGIWDQDITTDIGRKFIQEGALLYTERRHNGFIRTENQAQRDVSKRPSYHI